MYELEERGGVMRKGRAGRSKGENEELQEEEAELGEQDQQNYLCGVTAYIDGDHEKWLRNTEDVEKIRARIRYAGKKATRKGQGG